MRFDAALYHDEFYVTHFRFQLCLHVSTIHCVSQLSLPFCCHSNSVAAFLDYPGTCSFFHVPSLPSLLARLLIRIGTSLFDSSIQFRSAPSIRFGNLCLEPISTNACYPASPAMVRRVSVPSDTLTSITPPSLVDDGHSFIRRMPRGSDPAAITAWIEGTAVPPVRPPTPTFSESVADTRSFFDDGADIRRSSTFEAVPGFGPANHKFYSKGKPKKGKYEEEWTVEKEKALAGDMFRSLARLKSVARVEVRDAQDVEKKKAREERKKGKVGALEDDGRVRIMKPLKWGTFIIEGKDGRVVIVDEQGEFDSGKMDEREELERREREHDERVQRRKEKKQKEAKKAADKRAGEEERRARKLKEQEKREKRKAEKSDKERDRRHHRRGRRPHLEKLVVIPEDDTPEENVFGMASPTGFFMTGTQDAETPSVLPIMKSPASPISHRKSSSDARSTSRKSSNGFVPSSKSLIAPTAHSNTDTSTTTSDDSQTRQCSITREASAVKLPSSVSSVNYSKATPSIISAAASRSSRARADTSFTIDNSTFTRTQTVESWKADTYERSARGNSKQGSSITSSRVSSTSPWKDKTRTGSVASSKGRETSQNHSHISLAGDLDPEPEPKKPASTSSNRPSSRTRSRVSSRNSAQKTSRSSTHSQVTAWLRGSSPGAATFGDSPPKSIPSVRSRRSTNSQASGVTPYSWRRHVEEISDHSTIGSAGSPSRVSSHISSRIHSPIPSVDLGSDGESISRGNEDTVSVKSHSTYRAPTVQEVTDEEDGGGQDWDTAWGAKDDQGDRDDDDSGQKASEVGSAKWSEKTGWGGDVVPEASVVGGSQHDAGAKGGKVGVDTSEEKDKSGYEENNETWLNAEVEGVKYREAEWRTSPTKGLWKDV